MYQKRKPKIDVALGKEHSCPCGLPASNYVSVPVTDLATGERKFIRMLRSTFEAIVVVARENKDADKA